MIIFGYEKTGGMMLPRDDTVWRFLIMDDYYFDKDVVVWRGSKIESYALGLRGRMAIQDLIDADKSLFKIEALEPFAATDMPSFGFYYSDEEDRNLHYVSGYITNESQKDSSSSSAKLMKLTDEVARILKQNSIDILR